jgi:hypothetical protein
MSSEIGFSGAYDGQRGTHGAICEGHLGLKRLMLGRRMTQLAQCGPAWKNGGWGAFRYPNRKQNSSWLLKNFSPRLVIKKNLSPRRTRPDVIIVTDIQIAALPWNRRTLRGSMLQMEH